MTEQPATPEQLAATFAAHIIGTAEQAETINVPMTASAQGALVAAIGLAQRSLTPAATATWLRSMASALIEPSGDARPGTPTTLQADTAALAQHEVEEVLRRMLAEGMDMHAVMTGGTTAIAALLQVGFGDAAVPSWFANMHALTKHMGASN